MLDTAPDYIFISIIKNGPTNGWEVAFIILFVMFAIGLVFLFIGGLLSLYWSIRDEYRDYKNGIFRRDW